MKTPNHHLMLAILGVSLTACSTAPKQQVAELRSAIDARYQGHYGQSLLHEKLADDNQQVADRILQHWENDQYWNIDEKQKAFDATKLAALHRHESEKELCHWLTEVHGHNHHKLETSHHAAIYFNTGSAVPIRVNDEHLHTIGHFLHLHPQATATVTSQTDTVGKSESNQLLSERRAETVKQLLIEHGAKDHQLNIKAIGEAIGADNTAVQENRVVSISINYPESYSDCPKL